MGAPKIAFVDLEVAPSLGWIYRKWEADVLAFEKDWYILCFAVKWMGKGGVKVIALPDFALYKRQPENDEFVVKALWEVINEADIIVWHNGDAFDAKKANSRFLVHNLPPPSPYSSIDTLKIARQKFGFTSNALGDLGQNLKVGEKTKVKHSDIWQDCIRKNKRAWNKMRAYNIRDVKLLESIYMKLRGWAKSHPDLTVYDDATGCPTCRSKVFIKRGYSYTRNKIKPRFQCKRCFRYFTHD